MHCRFKYALRARKARNRSVTSKRHSAGLITRIGTNRLGGQTVWILGPGLERHYYAHLNHYGAFREGDRVETGDIIGYTGNTGNARGAPPHLHYGIYARGAALNPYPRLAAGRTRAVQRPVTPPIPGM